MKKNSNKVSIPILKKNNSEKNLCPSCGNLATNNFCSNCGEKIIERKYSFKDFLTNLLEGFYSFDTKFFRSLKFLISKPGFLTNEFLAGRRVNYTKPFQLFIILNIIMLITSSMFEQNIFSSSLNVHRKHTPYRKFAESLTKNSHSELNLTYEQYEIKFNNRLDNFSRTLIFIYIPFFALALILINRKRYFFEHFIHSIHLVSFILFLFGLIISPFLIFLNLLNSFGLNPGLENADVYILPILIIFLIVYLYFSNKRVYNNSLILSGIKSVFLLGAFFILFMGYRFLLFIIVYYTLRIF